MPAVVVQDVYKKFGKPADPFWKRWQVSRQNNSANSHNGNENGHRKEHDRTNGNGHTPSEMFCDRIPAKDEKQPTLEDIFLELTGKQLVNPEEEEESQP